MIAQRIVGDIDSRFDVGSTGSGSGRADVIHHNAALFEATELRFDQGGRRERIVKEIPWMEFDFGTFVSQLDQ